MKLESVVVLTFLVFFFRSGFGTEELGKDNDWSRRSNA